MFTVNMTTIWLWVWLFFSLGLLLICAWKLVQNKFLLERMELLGSRTAALEKSVLELQALKDAAEHANARIDALAKHPFTDEKCRNEMKALSDFCSGTMDALNRISKEELAAQEKDRQDSRERWLAITERLDAQGARIQELEAKVKIGFPTVPEEKSSQPVDSGCGIG